MYVCTYIDAQKKTKKDQTRKKPLHRNIAHTNIAHTNIAYTNENQCILRPWKNMNSCNQ